MLFLQILPVFSGGEHLARGVMQSFLLHGSMSDTRFLLQWFLPGPIPGPSSPAGDVYLIILRKQVILAK